MQGRLAVAIPEPRCELDHKDAWTLLIATILSANTNDTNSGRAFEQLRATFGPDWDAVRTAPLEAIKVAKDKGFRVNINTRFNFRTGVSRFCTVPNVSFGDLPMSVPERKQKVKGSLDGMAQSALFPSGV